MNQGYILNIPPNRKEKFAHFNSIYGYFAEPVEMFSLNRNYPLLVFISASPGMITHLAAGTGGITAGSGMRRLNLTKIAGLETPIPFTSVINRSAKRVKNPVEKIFANGGVIPPASFKEIQKCLIRINPALQAIMNGYLNTKHSFKKWSPQILQSLGYQKEAIGTALLLADLDRTPLQGWSSSVNTKPQSFLDGLDQVYLREDQMINSDLSVFPGFDTIASSTYSKVQFKGKGNSIFLDVIVANRTILEEQTGADLIYYNEHFRSFVLVQYKAMEPEPGGVIFRLPNARLQKEIHTMEQLASHLGKETITSHKHYRLTYNPFFLKLCPRIVFNPNENKLSAGMYINLDHWKIMENDDELTGPLGGRVITYRNLGRHITNTDFAALVKHSWVGTTPIQSEKLEKLITEILQSGKSVVYAIKRDTSNLSSSDDGEDFRPFDVNSDEADAYDDDPF